MRGLFRFIIVAAISLTNRASTLGAEKIKNTMRPSIGTAMAFSPDLPHAKCLNANASMRRITIIYTVRILRPRLAGFLSGALEWWRIWSVLDADAYWADVELWSITVRLCNSVRQYRIIK